MTVFFDLWSGVILDFLAFGTKQALADIHIMKHDSSFNKLDTKRMKQWLIEPKSPLKGNNPSYPWSMKNQISIALSLVYPYMYTAKYKRQVDLALAFN